MSFESEASTAKSELLPENDLSSDTRFDQVVSEGGKVLDADNKLLETAKENSVISNVARELSSNFDINVEMEPFSQGIREAFEANGESLGVLSAKIQQDPKGFNELLVARFLMVWDEIKNNPMQVAQNVYDRVYDFVTNWYEQSKQEQFGDIWKDMGRVVGEALISVATVGSVNVLRVSQLNPEFEPPERLVSDAQRQTDIFIESFDLSDEAKNFIRAVVNAKFNRLGYKKITYIHKEIQQIQVHLRSIGRVLTQDQIPLESDLKWLSDQVIEFGYSQNPRKALNTIKEISSLSRGESLPKEESDHIFQIFTKSISAYFENNKSNLPSVRTMVRWLRGGKLPTPKQAGEVLNVLIELRTRYGADFTNKQFADALTRFSDRAKQLYERSKRLVETSRSNSEVRRYLEGLLLEALDHMDFGNYQMLSRLVGSYQKLLTAYETKSLPELEDVNRIVGYVVDEMYASKKFPPSQLMTDLLANIDKDNEVVASERNQFLAVAKLKNRATAFTLRVQDRLVVLGGDLLAYSLEDNNLPPKPHVKEALRLLSEFRLTECRDITNSEFRLAWNAIRRSGENIFMT